MATTTNSVHFPETVQEHTYGDQKQRTKDDRKVFRICTGNSTTARLKPMIHDTEIAQFHLQSFMRSSLRNTRTSIAGTFSFHLEMRRLHTTTATVVYFVKVGKCSLATSRGIICACVSSVSVIYASTVDLISLKMAEDADCMTYERRIQGI